MDDSRDKHKKHHRHKESKDHSSKKSSKRHRRDDSSEGERKSRKHRRDKGGQGVHVVDEGEREDVWVEKNIDGDGLHVLGTDIPTSESLAITSHSAPSYTSPPSPPSLLTETKLTRDDWMLEPEMSSSAPPLARGAADVEEESLTEDYGEPGAGRRTLGGGVDFFSSLGTEKKKKRREDRPDPANMPVSARELNAGLKDDTFADGHNTPTPPKPVTPGGPGSQWRMMKLKRVYEAAEEENRPVEEVALERYDRIEAFNEAREERQWLDDRESRHSGRRRDASEGKPQHRGREEGEKRWMFSDLSEGSRPSSRTSFRRPAGIEDSAPSTPQQLRTFNSGGSTSAGPPTNKRLESLRFSQVSSASSPQMSKPVTPIPTVMTPPATGQPRPRALSPSSLNKLQARVLRAKLMDQPNANALEKLYEEEIKKVNGSADTQGGTRVEVLPTLDVRGRMYDVGQGQDDGTLLPGNRRKKEKVETRDPKTGELLRYNADDDSISLGDMLRQERFGAGMADQKDLDVELAGAILGDGKFENDLEYMDDNAERLGRKKMRTDAMKRQFAIHDYARTQKALATCPFCYGEDDSLPKAPIVAMATRAYLSCTSFEELVEGHCYIVPIQHHLSMLEGDDDLWDEVRNFMKCLIRMFSEQDNGVVFYETVLSLKWQKHSVIECVPVPTAQFDDLPAYFKESILASEAEWSQHKKLIDFSVRPGGFRRAMVPNLPYFMVQFDYKGEKGYGHVIEGVGDSAEGGEADGALDEGEKAGEFPRYFAAEIIGNVLDVEPRRWRRPRKVDFRRNAERVEKFRKQYNKYDWTGMIGGS